MFLRDDQEPYVAEPRSEMRQQNDGKADGGGAEFCRYVNCTPLLFCVEKAAAGKHSSAIPGSAGAGAHDAVEKGRRNF